MLNSISKGRQSLKAMWGFEALQTRLKSSLAILKRFGFSKFEL